MRCALRRRVFPEVFKVFNGFKVFPEVFKAFNGFKVFPEVFKVFPEVFKVFPLRVDAHARCKARAIRPGTFRRLQGPCHPTRRAWPNHARGGQLFRRRGNEAQGGQLFRASGNKARGGQLFRLRGKGGRTVALFKKVAGRSRFPSMSFFVIALDADGPPC